MDDVFLVVLGTCSAFYVDESGKKRGIGYHLVDKGGVDVCVGSASFQETMMAQIWANAFWEVAFYDRTLFSKLDPTLLTGNTESRMDILSTLDLSILKTADIFVDDWEPSVLEGCRSGWSKEDVVDILSEYMIAYSVQADIKQRITKRNEFLLPARYGQRK